MFDTIVVGIDGPVRGPDAITLARRLANPSARIVMVHVVSHPPTTGAAGPGGYEDAFRRDAEEMLASVTASGDEIRVLRDASAARALHALAEDIDADLIVVASSRHGVLGRVLLGDVARATLHGAPCSVAVAPRGSAATPPALARVGVGVAEGDASTAAVERAWEIARATGADLLLVTAVRSLVPFAPGDAYSFDWSDVATDRRDQATRHLTEIADRLGARAAANVVDDVPSRALEQLSHRVDLLVLGSRGWGPLRRVVLGSTTDAVIHRAACPLLVVPRPAPVRETTAVHERTHA